MDKSLFVEAFHPLMIWRHLHQFLEQGGVILVVIMLTTFFLWMLILERQYYFWFIHKKVCQQVTTVWQQRADKHSWFSHQIRQRLLSMTSMQTQRNLSTIKLVVVIAPLLGLLGTVVGMIEVFDVMASTGASNARGMAGGVSKATIPTMAGMVVSLSGLLFSVTLKRRATLSMEALSNQLVKEEPS